MSVCGCVEEIDLTQPSAPDRSVCVSIAGATDALRNAQAVACQLDFSALPFVCLFVCLYVRFLFCTYLSVPISRRFVSLPLLSVGPGRYCGRRLMWTVL